MFLSPTPELLIIKDWIITLSPIWGAALIVRKPLKAVGISVYNRYIKEPDENQNVRLDKIEASMRRMEGRQDLSHDAYIALLHDRIYQCCTCYIRRGVIKQDELKNLEYLYQPYHEAGGNGTAKKLYLDCQELPLNTDD